MGSALKFGLLAAGAADVYPRHGPTNEWDTAAGQAILEAVGGCVTTLDGKPLLYGKKGAELSKIRPSSPGEGRPKAYLSVHDDRSQPGSGGDGCKGAA